MANNYCQFSFQVPLCKGKHVFTEAVKIIDEGYARREAANVEGQYDALDAIGFDFQYEASNGDLVIFTEETGSPDDAVVYVETLLRKKLAREPVMIEWAYTCSSPRIDNFGGGGALVTKDKTYWFMPSRFMELKWEQIRRKRNKPKRRRDDPTQGNHQTHPRQPTPLARKPQGRR